MQVLIENKEKFAAYQEHFRTTLLELLNDPDEDMREIAKEFKVPEKFSDIFCPYQVWLDNLTEEDKEKYKIVPDENRDFSGIYICKSSNDHYLIEQTTDYKEAEQSKYKYDYGIVDNATQILDNAELPENCIVLVTPQFNHHDGPCGWRWHKWGPYYGIQNPQYEHLSSEKDIEMVYTFRTVILEKC